tara:strand:+ start:5799 stop:6905 length:1107 start_codon:yes stop_codon:yes gene_type:complete
MFVMTKKHMMKHLLNLKCIFIALIVVSFSACENEPLEGEFAASGGANLTCEQAAQATVSAGLALSDATTENVDQLCNTYSLAIEQQITSCGDETGVLQQLLDSIEDCSAFVGGGGSTSGIFDFDIVDGDAFEGVSISAVSNEDGLLVDATVGTRQAGFQIFNPVQGTTYDLSDPDQAILLYDTDISNEESDVFFAISGSLTLSTYNTNTNIAGGSFSGVMQEFFTESTITVENGIFQNIEFSVEEPVNSCTATIDGAGFNASLFPVVFVQETIQVTFDDDMGRQIRIIFPDNIIEGTYDLAATPEIYSATYTESDVDYTGVENSGSIVITNVENDVVTGSFNFDVVNDGDPEDVIVITSGEFVIDVSF